MLFRRSRTDPSGSASAGAAATTGSRSRTPGPSGPSTSARRDRLQGKDLPRARLQAPLPRGRRHHAAGRPLLQDASGPSCPAADRPGGVPTRCAVVAEPGGLCPTRLTATARSGWSRRRAGRLLPDYGGACIANVVPALLDRADGGGRARLAAGHGRAGPPDRAPGGRRPGLGTAAGPGRPRPHAVGRRRASTGPSPRWPRPRRRAPSPRSPPAAPRPTTGSSATDWPTATSILNMLRWTLGHGRTPTSGARAGPVRATSRSPRSRARAVRFRSCPRSSSGGPASPPPTWATRHSTTTGSPRRWPSRWAASSATGAVRLRLLRRHRQGGPRQRARRPLRRRAGGRRPDRRRPGGRPAAGRRPGGDGRPRPDRRRVPRGAAGPRGDGHGPVLLRRGPVPLAARPARRRGRPGRALLRGALRRHDLGAQPRPARSTTAGSAVRSPRLRRRLGTWPSSPSRPSPSWTPPTPARTGWPAATAP